MGVIGVVREERCGIFFSDFKPELQAHLKSIRIMRAVKAAMEYVKQYRGPVMSLASGEEGCRLLQRLGFDYVDGDVYAWLN